MRILIFIMLNISLGLYSEGNPLKIEKISIDPAKNGHEVLVCFNRKLNSSELLPDRNKIFKYSYEFKIESKAGWETSSKSVMSNLSIEDNLRNNDQCYVVTTIGKGKVIQKDYSKGEINIIQIRIFDNTSGTDQKISEMDAENL